MPTDINLLKPIYRYFQFFSPIFSQLPIFYWPPIPIFQNFAYQYICRYFNKLFWLKLVGIAYTSLVHFTYDINQYKLVYFTAKMLNNIVLARYEKFY